MNPSLSAQRKAAEILRLIFSTPELQERFWSKVDKTGDCWVWTGGRHRQGYGIFTVKGPIKAHRVSFFLANRGISLDLKVLHKCDNPPCVNPAHLRQGTQADNVADMIAKGRDKRGEPLAADKNPMARLTWEKVRRIRAMYVKGEVSQYDIAAQFGVAVMTINRVIRKESWRETV